MKRYVLIILTVCGLLPMLPSQAKARDYYGYPGWRESHRPHWNYWAWRRHHWREHWRRHYWRERYWHRWHDDD
jgi:hypothetical protein